MHVRFYLFTFGVLGKYLYMHQMYTINIIIPILLIYLNVVLIVLIRYYSIILIKVLVRYQ